VGSTRRSPDHRRGKSALGRQPSVKISGVIGDAPAQFQITGSPACQAKLFECGGGRTAIGGGGGRPEHRALVLFIRMHIAATGISRKTPARGGYVADKKRCCARTIARNTRRHQVFDRSLCLIFSNGRLNSSTRSKKSPSGNQRLTVLG
jgi:hypothetical protein